MVKTADYFSRQSKHVAADRHRLKKYGLSATAFTALLTSVNSQCEICHVDLVIGSRQGTGLAVDHSHATGKVRGILCNHCNRGLGMFTDSQGSLASAITYLNKEPMK